LALTATATNKVAEDIQEKLKFINKNIIKSGYERKNLIYLVRNVEDKNNYILTVLQKIKGSGIIYVRNRKKTKEIANYLLNHKIPASYYHAGLKTNTRSERQNNWNSGITRIIVATNAFGMGIDKPDVRFVIHYDLPDSVEEYYQEAGRAGRDGKKSYGVLLFNNSDNLSVKQRIRNNFPDIDTIKKVYQALGNYLKVPIGGGKGNAYDFNLATFASNYNLNIRIAYSSLKFLEREGYIELTEDIDNPSRVHFIVNRDDLYKFQVANANLDGFIKLLLRSYTGIFNEYVNINEEILAKRANITRDMVYEFLVMLSKFKIINYIPQKKTPLVVYTEERLDDKNLRISKENYKDRKERYLERLNALLDYASNKTKCRNMILLNYFGEKDTYRCGQCDNCNIRNELGLSEYEFNKILKEIKKKLKETPHLLNELVNSINQPNEKTIKVIQWLLDNDKLKYDKENKLEWH
ncbi:MAG: RecQ family ATP-dependent DNA helicase, partial [Bacteroidales bacterium]|nr:RecQ family ATP-dependent DNA helicase [Bacteroidales bacterium]